MSLRLAAVIRAAYRPRNLRNLRMAPKPAPALAPLAMDGGLSFAEWIDREGLSKSTGYKYATALAVRRPLRLNPATGRREPWLLQADAELMTAYARALREGAKPAEALALVGRGALVPTTPATTPAESTEPADSADDRDRLELLSLRLGALRDAVELGAPLSRADAAALLGVVPGAGVGESVTRGAIEAQHLARGVWRLRKSETARARERW